MSPAVGTRWFREGGGMPSITLAPPSGRYLYFAEREEIGILTAQDVGVCEIAQRLGRAPSTISREVRRNAATRSGQLDYRASTAQWHADRRARRPKRAKLATNPCCSSPCRTGCPPPSRTRTASRCPAHRCRGTGAGTGGESAAATEARSLKVSLGESTSSVGFHARDRRGTVAARWSPRRTGRGPS